MNDTQYPNLFIHHFEGYPIIPNSQLPIAAKCLPQGFNAEMRRSNPSPDSMVDAGPIRYYL
jgi:hypothetical protein